MSFSIYSQTMKHVNIFCLPFAGGNKYSYRPLRWQEYGLNMIGLDYPGRGGRIADPLMDDLGMIANDLCRILGSQDLGDDYLLYGHSMGGIVGFELIHRLAEAGIKPPVHFVVTGTTAPSCTRRSERNWHHLPKPAFIRKLRELNGFPDEVLADPDMFDFIEPIIRADFKALECYQYEKRLPLSVPITIITGTDEDIGGEEITAWQKETTQRVDFLKMNGNHFFIFDTERNNIPKLLSERLTTPKIYSL